MKPLLPLLATALAAGACAANPGSSPAARMAASSPAPVSAANASATPATQLALPSWRDCTPSGPASADWPPAPALPGRATITASAAGDTLTLKFDRGTPAYQTRPQSTSHFTRDASGQPVTLAGAAGVEVVLLGLRGDVGNYSGPSSLTSHGSLLREAAAIGDSEGIVTWAAGLAATGCAVVVASDSTLTIRFVPQPAPDAAPVIAAADVEAVARQVYQGPYHMGCTMHDPCPVTVRLAARVFAVPSPRPVGPGPSDAFCRCQNPASQAMSVSGEVTATGGVAHVVLYPDVHPIRIDLILVLANGKLLVDDMRCTGGGPSTSVYAAELAPCG